MGNRVVVMSLGTALLAACVAFLFVPTLASAARFDRGSLAERIIERVNERLCDRQRALAGRLHVPLVHPSKCEKEEPPPPPPTEPIVDISADSAVIEEGESATLMWESEHADSCVASGDWIGARAADGSESVSPTATSTYEISCTGAGGEAYDSVTIAVIPAEPEPEPEEIIVVINEIAWMGSLVAGENATSSTSTNAEWIELRNLGANEVDLIGWTLVASSTPPDIAISEECANTIIPAGGFYLLTRSPNSAELPSDCEYDGALANSGELLLLRNASDELVNSVNGVPNWEIGTSTPAGNNSTKETAQRADDGTWFTATSTPKAAN